MVRVGLIGAGNWGANLARVLNQNAAIDFAGIYDLDIEKLKRMARCYPHVTVCSSLSELFGQVDAVVIATPIRTHYRIAREALAAGKHVFVEKPLASTSEEAESLTLAARKCGRVLMVGHTFMYAPAVQKIKAAIDSGKLGDLHYVTCQRVNLGVYRTDADVSADLAVHDISILLYWLQELPVAASSFGRACLQPGNLDVGFMWLEFPSGVIASIEVSWLSPQKLRRTCVVGSAGTIVYDDTELCEKVKIYNYGLDFREPENFGEFQLSYRVGDTQSPALRNIEPLAAELDHFFECIRSGSRPHTDGEFGTNVVRILEMARANHSSSIPVLGSRG